MRSALARGLRYHFGTRLECCPECYRAIDGIPADGIRSRLHVKFIRDGNLLTHLHNYFMRPHSRRYPRAPNEKAHQFLQARNANVAIYCGGIRGDFCS